MDIDKLEEKGKVYERGLRGWIAKAPNWAVGIAFVAGALVMWLINRA